MASLRDERDGAAGSDPGPQPMDAEGLIEETASRLRALLQELASRLRPFPAFLDMLSLQAVEVDPRPAGVQDRGCVVVLPGGEICELDLKELPGVAGVIEPGQVDEVRELELPPEEYILYAAAAIHLLYGELRRRGR